MGNVSDDEAEPAPLGVKRAQRSAKKVETKGRAPSAAKAGHMAVWAGAKAEAVEKIDSEESDNKGAQARKGADRAGKTPKKKGRGTCCQQCCSCSQFVVVVAMIATRYEMLLPSSNTI